jgi:hypothetical protein
VERWKGHALRGWGGPASHEATDAADTYRTTLRGVVESVHLPRDRRICLAQRLPGGSNRFAINGL